MRQDLGRAEASLIRSNPNSAIQTLSYFILTVLGFSFWFFMVVPFASHRETYWWLAMVHSQPLTQSFGVISSTYRPLSQPATWLAFMILDPHIFPTSVVRQTLLQGFVYGMFVLAWWLVYSVAPQKRLFALLAFVAGGVFFSGYVHLFHVYGIMYVPVMLMLGALIRSYVEGEFEKREMWFAVVAMLLACWHPFATALFIGFYFGFYVDTFGQRSGAQHVKAILILLLGMTAVAATVLLFPRTVIPLDTKLFGFLLSYQTNEINLFASFVAFLFTQLTVFSMGLSPRARMTAFLSVAALSIFLLLNGIPLLLLWPSAVLMKLLRMRCWPLFFLMLTAAVLPLGGGIGGPIHALFAIIVALYVTSLGMSSAETALTFLKPRYVVGATAVLAALVLLVRAGVEVPIITKAAGPLLTERERTYQLEHVLAWLHNSDYCGYEIAFTENAGSPINDVQSAIKRRNRPPAAFEDVHLFWETVLRCQKGRGPNDKAGTALVTFGGPALANLSPVFKAKGRYAGDATVWIRDSQRYSALLSR